MMPLFPGAAIAEKPPLLSKRFDLTAQATEVIRDKALHNGTVLQSFAFDNANSRIYTVQLMAGGLQLPGEAAPVSGGTRDGNGDMALTELDAEGNETGYMYLKGFGHGVQIGVETVGDTSYLWTETDSVKEGSSGWGTQLARFKFENGKVLTPASPELEKFKLMEGIDRTTVNIDPTNNLLTMRYRKDGSFRYGVYDLEAVKRREFQPIADVAQPTVGTFQGFVSYGGFLYLLEGNSFGSGGSTAPVGNTYITTVNLQTGEVEDKQLVSAGADVTFREPEGMAIRLPDAKHGQKAELCLGFASDFTPHRLANIFAFDQLLPDQALDNRRSGQPSAE
ncbi:hypothetical protein MJA45_15390 [Paenibacillus aurantius]|uniref:P68 RBP/TagC-like beta-propeller domain-containing protein n=1 Tax=Paenibacillus aurantius TaxID=2918900 RepID=A0AA96L986_9BACL|nr:hypothetical protein [Paenibacillus aurantius]WNQ09030.1 hypothetical protein MJA45_15390 [Paenibacillus aurantius]